MKKIVSIVSAILSILFTAISICGMSIISCWKGQIAIFQVFVLNENMFYTAWGLGNRTWPYILIPFFYFSLILTFLSGVLNFEKKKIFKSIITIIASIVPIVYGINTNDYILFLILLNLHLMLYVLINYSSEKILDICIEIASAIIAVMNIILLVIHSMLTFDYGWDRQLEQSANIMIIVSRLNLMCLILWFVPYIILLVKDILGMRKKD